MTSRRSMACVVVLCLLSVSAVWSATTQAQAQAAPPPAPAVSPATSAPAVSPAAATAPAAPLPPAQPSAAPPAAQYAEQPAMPAGPEPEPTPAPHAEWYGWQTLSIDVAGLMIGIIADSAGHYRPSTVGLATASWYGVGAVFVPAVHYAHGNLGGGLASFGFRLLVPLLASGMGAVVNCLRTDDFTESCSEPGLIGGALLGMTAAAVADAALFAKEDFSRPMNEGTTSYGLSVLAVDLAGYGLGIAFAASNPHTKKGEAIAPPLAVWSLAYPVGAIGAPIVHFVHGELGRGLASLGLRFLVGPAGALPGLIGYCAATAGVKGCVATGAEWGVLGGGIAVGLIDALVLARSETSQPAQQAAAGPSLQIGPGSIAVGGRW